MVTSQATTVEEYLAALPDERRMALSTVREAILERLPEGIVETMDWGMIAYEVPLETFPDTYNGRPLLYAGLAAQKRHLAVYLTTVYVDPERVAAFRDRYLATGKRLDMGKSCVRFRRLDDLALDVVADEIGAHTLQEFLDHHRAARG
jgi:uncharacterized protein YdhG (YjbR/CyaY superfamily)